MMKTIHNWQRMGVGLGAGLMVLCLGCSSPDEYYNDADKEVYSILNTRQEQVLGEKDKFDINTPFSNRLPEAIPPSEIIKERFSEGTNTLTLASALEMAVKNSRDYQLQRETLYLSALSLTGERHKFALRFTGANIDLERDRSTGGVNSTSSDASFTLSKALDGGGKVTARLADNLKIYFDGSGPKVPGLTFTLTQPLLKGSGKDMALESLTQSERNLVYSIRSFSRYQEKFLVDRTSDYLNLLLLQMQLRVEYQLLQNRIRFREEQELRLQGELISQFELDQALRQEYETKNNYISRVETYLSSLDAFKKQLNLPLGKELVLDNSELPQLEEIGVSQVPLSDEYGFQLALTNRLDILNEVDKFQDKKRKVKVAKNDLLPSLGLVADYSLKDQYYNQNSFDFGDYSAKAGLSLDLALDKLSERNAYRKSRIDFERQLRSLMETMDGLLDELRKNVRSLERNRQSYIINKKKLEASQRELEKARLDLLVGDRVRPRDILEAQSGVARARNTYYSSLINFHIQRLKLLNNAGILDTAPQNWWRETQQIPGIQPLESGDEADEDLPVVPPDEILGTNE
ncbi:MAG: hypothetical protein CL763_05950 [Chloroflexi bacterium]|nr:hypothetical protein [Chloroflexota bacterium]